MVYNAPFEYEKKSLDYDTTTGLPSQLVVYLKGNNGQLIGINLDPVHNDKSNAELLFLAKEEIYRTEYPKRAETEKFNEINSKLIEVNNVLFEAKKELTNLIASSHEVSKITNTTETTTANLLSILLTNNIITEEDLMSL